MSTEGGSLRCGGTSLLGKPERLFGRRTSEMLCQLRTWCARASLDQAVPILLGHEGAAAILVNVDAHDLVERAFAGESEFTRAMGVDALGPAFDNVGDERVMLAADATRNALAGNAAKRIDLLPDRAANAGHGKIDPRPERLSRDSRGVNEKAHGRARGRGV